MPIDSEQLAATLHRAYVDAEPINAGSLPSAPTVADGYAAQDEFVESRTSDEGPVIGYKVGFTNEAVQSNLGVDEPAYGRVLEDTIRWNRRFEVDSLIEPRVEPELAFVLGEDLDPSADRLDVLSATRFVVPVIEVVDSRIGDWDFTAPAAIADNALAARLLLGDGTPVTTTDFALEAVEVLINGDHRATGTGAAVLGHPADAVAWLADALVDRGDSLETGDIVTTGSLTEPIPVDAGDTIAARFSSLGTVMAQAASAPHD
ncbi:MAG: 2-keto-4-pentenoate hydratase [Natronomonas sp.]|jgi:2-keto-4-pentenoate hydratase|uniref:2-keto-4-pentenoate hydratase n=1 Tax=Natronomonas sp. TaxID=2184060 RepID=UPI003988F4B0